MNDINFVWESVAAEMNQKGEFTREAILNAPACIKTGFPKLDELLGGGLMPGLMILGGSPGLGKSTLALYIAEHVAWKGTPVLYFSYEMSHLRIKSKLIACRNYEDKTEKELLFEAKELFNSETTEKWKAEKWNAFEEAHQAVLGRGENLFIIDCNNRKNRYTAKGIAKNVEAFVKEKGKRPLVIVDYLQILPSDSAKPVRSERQAVDDNLEEMSALSESMNLPIILISSLSRGNYKKPMQIDAFKDSGGIEYAADVLLGIQFSACHDENGDAAGESDWSLEAEKKKDPRSVEVVILKQRYGSTGDAVPLLHYPKYDAFAPQPGRTQGLEEAGLQEASVQNAAVLYAASAGEEGVSRQAEEGAQGEAAPADAGLSEKAPSRKEPSQHRDNRMGYINNTMIAHELRKGEAVPNAWHRCQVLPERAGLKSVYTEYQISYQTPCEACGEDRQQSCKGCKKVDPLTSYDYAVADAIFSIFLSGQRKFTLRRVLTTLTGDSHQTPTEQKKKELRTSIEKLRNTRITIDCTEEMGRRHPGKSGFAVVFRGPLLSVTQDEGVYYFPGEDRDDLKNSMPLHAYAQMTRQIIAFPASLLRVTVHSEFSDGARKLSDTAEAIVIKRFLIYRLETIQNEKTSNKNKMRTISFESHRELSKELGIRDDRSKPYSAVVKRRRQARKTVQAVLDYFQRIGYIDGYERKDSGNPPSILIREAPKKPAGGPQKK